MIEKNQDFQKNREKYSEREIHRGINRWMQAVPVFFFSFLGDVFAWFFPSLSLMIVFRLFPFPLSVIHF